MLIYLTTNTRPDIRFAVSQVSRYNKAPKQSHATAVKTIICYLKRTRDKDMIVLFTSKLDLNCFVDADFAGMFNQQPPRKIDSASSRCGYIIILGGIPVVWKSALMTAICLSTLEAEYQALSMAMRQLINFKLLIEELTKYFKINDSKLKSQPRSGRTTREPCTWQPTNG
jgi:hypothetical protein